MTKIVPSVSVSYVSNGSSTKFNELGMRPMQERVYERRGEQYLLIKSPPASGQSCASSLSIPPSFAQKYKFFLRCCFSWHCFSLCF